MDRVADSPALKDWLALISVRTGFIHVGSIVVPPFNTSGTPSGASTSISISILSPSSNHLVPSSLVRVSYQDSQG